jgi:O-antigen/teichoic acid export membrane protein
LDNKPIRLRYSGFIVFVNQLLGVVTGLIFTLLLTRSMTSAEYGTWTNMFDYTPYFIILGGTLPFWVLRFVARGKEGAAKTAALTQLLIAVVATIAYLPAIYFISNAIGNSQYLLIYLLAGGYVFTYHLISIFEGILQAVKPQTTGYGFMIQEIVKVVVALVVILIFKQVFLGAMLALVIAPTVQSIYYAVLLRGFFKEKLNWSYLKQWLKGSPIQLYSAIGTTLLSFAFIILYTYSHDARGYYQAALSFTTIVSYAASLSVSLYPRLLANSSSQKEVSLSFKTVMMMAIPLAALCMVMSFSFLTVLHPADLDGGSYGVAWPVLIALTVDTLIILISGFYSSCLMGIEAFDAEGQISLRELVKSKIFKVYSIPYIQAAFIIPLTYYVLTQMPVDGPVSTAVAFVGVLIAVHAATFVGLYVFMRQSLCIPVAWASVTKYILAALLMGVVLYFLPTTTTLMATIAKTLAGFLLYIGLLLAIDSGARELLRLIWQEITVTLKPLIHRNSGENAADASEN